jgi:photosystem II stability/assembly factor-like uncharacterized protein
MKAHKLFPILLFVLTVSGSMRAQWTTKYTGTPSPPSNDVPYPYMLSVVDSNTVWAVLHEWYGDFSDNRFVRTSDGGASWQQGTIPENSMLGYTLNVFGIDALNAWVIRSTLPEEQSFLYKTADGGMNWSEVMLPFTDDTLVMIAMHFFNDQDGVIYAEAHDGTAWSVKAVYTQDGGQSWQFSNTPYQAGERIFIWYGNNVFAAQGDTMWFGTSLSRVFRTIDKGLNWEAFNVPFYHTRPIGSVSFLDAKNGIAATALSDSLGGTLAFNEALRTEDGGETWTRIPIPRDIDNEPRLVGLAAIPGSHSAYMLYGYWQSNLAYKQMISLDHGQTWTYVLGPEAKTRSLQFISPTEGWAGGFAYNSLHQTYVERIYKWSGPPIIGETSSATEWNRLQEALELSPNPSTNQLNIRIQEAQAENYLVEVFNMEGDLLISENVKSTVQHTFSVKSWPTGAYIVRISGAHGMTARTLLKQ